ncbi:hypothetical protein F5883DRAFT_594420 [Diaporthe sp. PMI_573]|nr:hypothetical protein F5883DRAFT_594420 [Diaporthaceae sp. PMI_573]
MLQTLCQAYKGEPMDEYPSYSTFISLFRPDDDPVDKLLFWASERDALERSEGASWPLKQSRLLNRENMAEEVLEVPDALGFVYGPLQRIASEANMTLPLFTEAIFSLSLTLYFSQQSPSFIGRGSSIVYDRTASLRMADPRFSAVRAVTGAFHPHSMPLDLARNNLWTYLQHFNAMVRLRERNLCIGSTAELARHAVAFTWRFHDSEPKDPGDAGALFVGFKGEGIDFRGFSMCYICVNRKGPDGLKIAVGCHPKWLAEQQRNGSRVELVDVFSRALSLVLGGSGRLCDLALGDLEAASLEAGRT